MIKKILTTIFIILSINISLAEEINNEKEFLNKVKKKLSNYQEKKYRDETIAYLDIDKEGNFEYRIIIESDIKIFNDNVKKFLNEKKKEKFPVINNKGYTLIYLFKAEMEESAKKTNIN